jgi:hypothetical protein
MKTGRIGFPSKASVGTAGRPAFPAPVGVRAPPRPLPGSGPIPI